MKKQLGIIIIFAFSTACTFNMGTPANNGVSGSNPPAANTAPVKTGQSTAPEAGKNTETASTKTEEPASSGQKPERIAFSAGKTDASLTRTIPANGSVEFVFNAQSGQRMQYSVMHGNGSDTDVEAVLTEPGSQDISMTSAANENNEFIIKKTGDHRVTVSNKTGNKVTVDFGLSIK